MGQCGCADMGPVQTFPGPDGSVYALNIYDGCPECQTPLGLRVYRFDSQEDRERWDIDHAPKLEFNPEIGCAYVTVLFPQVLIPKLTESFAELAKHWWDNREIYELVHAMREDPEPPPARREE